jgi:multidrug efflux pump subunit AcrA (membrane-fusion protein)
MDSESDPQTDVGLKQHEWPRTWQVRVLALGGAVILLAWLAVSLGTYFMDRGGSVTVAATAAPPDGAFRATSAQLADLKIEPVTKMEFRTEHITEGRIALNGDKTTQVFSPYSGRVVKVMAALGDPVREGTPLLAVAASEFVQGQNDLINAAAQLNLAQANAKRKQALYESRRRPISSTPRMRWRRCVTGCVSSARPTWRSLQWNMRRRSMRLPTYLRRSPGLSRTGR